MSKIAGPNVAVLGLGSMGLGIATTLVKAGFAVKGYDPSAEAQSRFAAVEGTVLESPAQAAKGADIVICVVVNAAQTETALFGSDGAATTMLAGGTILSCATMSPDAARGFSAQAGALGMGFLDAPISGGAAKAATGQMTVMASGPTAAFAHAKPVLDCIAAKVYELGPDAGTGAAFKIVNQLLAGVHIAAACEAITFARGMGLDIAKVYEVITAAAGNSWMFENRVPHILDGDYSPRSSVNIFTKDLGIVSDIGRGMTLPTPMAATALQMFVMTAAAGMGRDDDASVARMLAGLAGLDLPGQPA